MPDEQKKVWKKVTNPYIFRYLYLRDEQGEWFKFSLVVDNVQLGYLYYEKIHGTFEARLNVLFEPIPDHLPKVTILGRQKFNHGLKSFWDSLNSFVLEENRRLQDISRDEFESALSDITIPKKPEEGFDPDKDDLPF